jgi:MFS family permease
LLLAWFGWVFDIMDSALFGLAKVPMLTQMMGERYKIDGGKVDSLLQVVFLLGWAVGGLIFGILADRWSRTRTLILTILLYCAFTGLTALCRTPEQVALVRFLTALGIGGEWAAGATLVAEVLPDRSRAGAASFIQSAAAFGPILAALINIALKGQAWQWLFVVGIAPAILCVLLRIGVQEPERIGGKPKAPLRELWEAGRYRRRAIVATAIGVVGIAGAGTATYWAPNLVKAVSAGLPKETLDARTSIVTMCSHVGTLLGVFLVPWLCQQFGRRRVIGGFFLLTPIVLLVGLQSPSYEKLLVALPFVNFFAIGVSASFVLYFPELFPGRIRATGTGLAYNVGRLFAIPVPLITGLLIDRFGGPAQGGVATAMILTGGIYLIGLVAVTFAPETKGQALPEE